ncbi:MAG: hypothetical protein IT168_20590 [Bryobacterales bacterium]|nr:hypothetical protein [Bryobacterales bacterium]
MAKARVPKSETRLDPVPKAAAAHSRHLAALALLALATLVFYWAPLTSSQTSQQWDAIDVHYTSQRYFSDVIRQGKLPEWVPYIYSGYPFLADPQVGAWYPLNWPFFLLGVTPASIQGEIALHVLIALIGTYLFVFRWTNERLAAAAGAMLYGFSGFFAGHASHVGMVETAAWLPWILLAVDGALRTGAPGWAAASGLLMGVAALAGHFQTLVYSGFAVVGYAVFVTVREKAPVRNVAVALVGLAVLTPLIAAAMLIPGMELLNYSVRSGMSFTGATNSPLTVGSLVTLVWPNALGAFDPPTYNGPADITQYYFYTGILLLPLAVLGLVKSPLRWPALVLIVPAFWYSLGPGFGFYDVVARLPGFGSVRAPVHMWFVVAMGFALAGGAGVAYLAQTVPVRAVVFAVLGIIFADLFYSNSLSNPLAYARESFADLYGNKLQQFQQRLGSQLPPLTRFHAPGSNTTFGPQNHPIDTRVETTYGYNPLALRHYADYFAAIERNPKLMDELGAKFRLDRAAGGVINVETAMPRVTIPPTVAATGDLATLDPVRTAIAKVDAKQDPNGMVTVTGYEPGSYKVHYKVASPSLVRVAEAWYPGWEAEAGGKSLPVVKVDGALMGVVVPAGEGDVTVRFRLGGVRLGMAISAVALAVAIAVVVMGGTGSEGSRKAWWDETHG